MRATCAALAATSPLKPSKVFYQLVETARSGYVFGTAVLLHACLWALARFRFARAVVVCNACYPSLQVAFGLYAEQLSGTAFTCPRSTNQRTYVFVDLEWVICATITSTCVRCGLALPDTSCCNVFAVGCTVFAPRSAIQSWSACPCLPSSKGTWRSWWQTQRRY